LILILCVDVRASLGVQMAISIDSETSSILTAVDYCVCALFLLDFLVRFAEANRRLR